MGNPASAAASHNGSGATKAAARVCGSSQNRTAAISPRLAARRNKGGSWRAALRGGVCGCAQSRGVGEAGCELVLTFGFHACVSSYLTKFV